jgi:hypothetical protein
MTADKLQPPDDDDRSNWWIPPKQPLAGSHGTEPHRMKAVRSSIGVLAPSTHTSHPP